MSEHRFKKLISGETKGIFAGSARLALQMLSVIYGLLTAGRNAAYQWGIRKEHRIGVPVIAIGNLTTGGTGKTPVVATIVQLLQNQDQRPGIVSRGYRADESGENDEKRVLKILCPDVAHEQNPDRVLASQQLIDSQHVNVVVLDDAFQHRRIGRDLNIVLIDATMPYGFGHLLPRGLLRESLSGLKRADMVFITRADNVSEEALMDIQSTVQRYKPELANRVHRVSFRPRELVTKSGEQQPISSLRDRRVTVLTAIGNPEAFVATCEQAGARIAATKFCPDHYHYTEQDLVDIQQLARTTESSFIVTTLKDLVKIPDGHDNIVAVQIETVFESASSVQKIGDELARATRIRHDTAQ